MRKGVIFELIKKMPGISYNGIVRETGLSNGVISHYIIKLIENKEIEKETDRRGKYFVKNISKKDRKIITILRNKTNNDIFKYLIGQSKSQDSSTAGEIAKQVKKSRSTISVSLKILQQNNIIERIILNQNPKLTNDIGYRILDMKVWSNYFIKYNL